MNSDYNIDRLKAGHKIRNRSKFHLQKKAQIQDILDHKNELNRTLMDSLRGVGTALSSLNHVFSADIE